MPLGESMITTLRNNKSQRLSQDRKAWNTLSVNSDKKEAFDFDQQTATNKELIKIRQRTERNQKRRRI